jgi:hypothetical protein
MVIEDESCRSWGKKLVANNMVEEVAWLIETIWDT